MAKAHPPHFIFFILLDWAENKRRLAQPNLHHLCPKVSQGQSSDYLTPWHGMGSPWWDAGWRLGIDVLFSCWMVGRPEVAPGKGGAARDSFGDMGTAAFANWGGISPLFKTTIVSRIQLRGCPGHHPLDTSPQTTLKWQRNIFSEDYISPSSVLFEPSLSYFHLLWA